MGLGQYATMVSKERHIPPTVSIARCRLEHHLGHERVGEYHSAPCWLLTIPMETATSHLRCAPEHSRYWESTRGSGWRRRRRFLVRQHHQPLRSVPFICPDGPLRSRKVARELSPTPWL